MGLVDNTEQDVLGAPHLKSGEEPFWEEVQLRCKRNLWEDLSSEDLCPRTAITWKSANSFTIPKSRLQFGSGEVPNMLPGGLHVCSKDVDHLDQSHAWEGLFQGLSKATSCRKQFTLACVFETARVSSPTGQWPVLQQPSCEWRAAGSRCMYRR